MRLIGCPETSVINYNFTLYKIADLIGYQYRYTGGIFEHAQLLILKVTHSNYNVSSEIYFVRTLHFGTTP
jgi:hypothetical protein